MAGKAPDVRVRLSAEGVQEVVSAFKRVQAEADKTGKAGGLAGRGISLLTGQIGSLARALPALTTGAVLAGFVALTKRALDTADALGKLGQKTGISVETLSTLAFGARTADVEQENLQKGLIQFVKTLDDYNQGAKSARNATRQLFGDPNALKGLTEDQALRKVIDALAKLEPGAKRTGLALEFFKKQGAGLLPLFDDLGNGGFDALAEKAERAGAKIDGEFTEAAQRANDALTDLKSAAEGIAAQFAAGLAPAAADAGQALLKATTEDGVSGFRILGQIAGAALKTILALIATVGFGITEVLGKAINLVVRSAELGVAALINGPGEAFREFQANLLAANAELEARLEARAKAFVEKLRGEDAKAKKFIGPLLPGGFRTPREAGLRDADRSQDLDQIDREAKARQEAKAREAKARRELEESLLDNALKLQKAHLSLREQAEKESFERGNQTIAQFYAERKRLAEEAAQAEIAAIRERLSRLETSPLEKGEAQADREKKIQDLRTQAAVLQIELEREIAGLAAEQRRAHEEADRERLSAEAQLLEAQGRRFEAERKELEAQIAGLQRLKGESDADFAARQDVLRKAGEQRITFAEIQAEAEKALAALDAARQAIIDKVRRGILSQLQGEEQIIALERERLPILEEIEARIRGAAITPEQVEQARQFAQALGELRISTDIAGQRMAALKQTFEEAAQSGLADFLGNLQDRVHDVGDAFRELGLSVAQAIQQLIARMLAAIIVARILKAVLGLFGGGGGAPTPVTVPAGGVGVASGGLIRGPGSSTSDSIPARLSDYEFVVRSAVVRQRGVLAFLRDLNAQGAPVLKSRRARGFAEGGLVEVAAGGSATEAGLTATLGLDEGLVLQRLEAHPKFKRVIIKTLENNRKAANSALGRTAL